MNTAEKNASMIGGNGWAEHDETVILCNMTATDACVIDNSLITDEYGSLRESWQATYTHILNARPC